MLLAQNRKSVNPRFVYTVTGFGAFLRKRYNISHFLRKNYEHSLLTSSAGETKRKTNTHQFHRNLLLAHKLTLFSTQFDSQFRQGGVRQQQWPPNEGLLNYAKRLARWTHCCNCEWPSCCDNGRGVLLFTSGARSRPTVYRRHQIVIEWPLKYYHT